MTRLNRLFGVAVLAASCLCASGALAQDVADGSHRTELVRQYLREINYEQNIQSVMSRMTSAMIDQMRSNHQGITEAQAKILREAADATMAAYTVKIIERVIPLYADAFSAQELQSLVDFYNTPTARAMMQKLPGIIEKTTPIMTSLMPEIQADMVKRVCEKMSCPRAGA